jgi:DNA-binding IclR family transcriptional regulator
MVQLESVLPQGGGARPDGADRLVKSAARVLQILEFFDRIQRKATVMEIADALAFPQSSTSALLRCLVSLGYLIYDPHARLYSPSSRVALLGSWVNPHCFSEGQVLRLMRELNARTGDAVVLAVRNGLEVQYIHVIQATNMVRLHITLGAAHSLARSGAGYAILAGMSDAEVTRIVTRINAERAEGEGVVNIAELLAALAEVRRQGYAFTTDLVLKGAGLLAAALPAPPDQPALIVGLGGVSEVMRPRREELVAILKQVMARYFGPAADEVLPLLAS